MVTTLSQKINSGDQNSDSGQLVRFMPKFLWILRDFTLKIEDERGRKISATQYL